MPPKTMDELFDDAATGGADGPGGGSFTGSQLQS